MNLRRNDAAAPSLARETATVGSSLVPCAGCHERKPVRLYRIAGGAAGTLTRPLCQSCFEAFDRLGMNVRAAA